MKYIRDSPTPPAPLGFLPWLIPRT